MLFDSDPELRIVAEDYLKQKKEGKIGKRLRKSDCRCLKDLCLLIFQKAQLNGEHQMLEKDEFVKIWVWVGHDFRDKLVDVVEEIAPQLSDGSELVELRLVATRVSNNGVQRLRRVFPNAEVTVYSDEEDRANWQLSQASYKVK